MATLARRAGRATFEPIEAANLEAATRVAAIVIDGLMVEGGCCDGMNLMVEWMETEEIRRKKREGAEFKQRKVWKRKKKGADWKKMEPVPGGLAEQSDEVRWWSVCVDDRGTGQPDGYQAR